MTLEVRARQLARIRIDHITGRIVATPRESGVALLSCDGTGRYEPRSQQYEAQPRTRLGTAANSVDPGLGLYDNPEREFNAGDSYTFDFAVDAVGGLVDSRYVLDITVTVNGRRLSGTIDDAGRPFVILSVPDGVGYSPPTYTFQPTPSAHLIFHPASS
jgi:hypothetical protein